MSQTNQKLEWCVVRLGTDLNWWVEEISDEIHWDVDGLGIIDPRQMSYILEQCDSLREYGFDPDIIDQAFYAFSISKELPEGRIQLKLSRESLLDDDMRLFALPDIMDEDKGPYADLIDQITRYRVKLLNDSIEFDQNLTIDELEEEIRERQNQDLMEGRAVHFFNEIVNILEYVPAGYELDEEDRAASKGEEDIDDLPDFGDDDEETLEEDDTMKWDEDEEEEEDEDLDEDGDRDEDEDDYDVDDDEEEEEEDRPRRRR
ncbi:MAG: hypothetical protein LR015_13800 [Verrucomicrobia bacterium]|nr:hypothetical protein [Verrucomicrobiota bacterium]